MNREARPLSSRRKGGSPYNFYGAFKVDMKFRDTKFDEVLNIF
jgi:hypothetical protein